MSEFVECQNCGRTFFAENLECPYCRNRDADDEDDDLDAARAAGGGMHRLLFAGFVVVLLVIVALALASMRRTAAGPVWFILGAEAGLAAVDAIGLLQRRRWARQLAIAFILANAGLAILAMTLRGRAASLGWGPGPLALLLFLVPFFSPQARERFSR